ncbi:unnamed protein product [Rhizoctonia solani]|uniref:CBM1 domain-containing protein n=1 Tax=Rhizoctonia solani TaxID=456999 RepID=A0A8H3B8T9_9AGAM|nr:unnamed protein product [Rhizoctonia solani]
MIPSFLVIGLLCMGVFASPTLVQQEKRQWPPEKCAVNGTGCFYGDYPICCSGCYLWGETYGYCGTPPPMTRSLPTAPSSTSVEASGSESPTPTASLD